MEGQLEPPPRCFLLATVFKGKGNQSALWRVVLRVAETMAWRTGEAAAYFQVVALELFNQPTGLHGVPLGASSVPSARIMYRLKGETWYLECIPVGSAHSGFF